MFENDICFISKVAVWLTDTEHLQARLSGSSPCQQRLRRCNHLWLRCYRREHFDLSYTGLANLLPLSAEVSLQPYLANELPPLVHTDVEAALCSFDAHAAPKCVSLNDEFG